MFTQPVLSNARKDLWTCSLSVRIVFSAHGIKPCITNSWTNTRRRSWSLSVRCAPCRTGVDCVLIGCDFATGPSAVTDISCIFINLSVPFGAVGANSVHDKEPSTWQRTSKDRERLAGASGWSMVVVPSTIQQGPDYQQHIIDIISQTVKYTKVK